nr:immunoglobulin heavy chain junction region [Macaca mulatta]
CAGPESVYSLVGLDSW